MKVVMSFWLDDDERARITNFFRADRDEKGLPRLATRALIRRWIGEAVDAHWINVEDVESSVDADR